VTTIYDDDALVRELTLEALERSGSGLLQIHRFAADSQAHANELLAIFNPPEDNRVADVGCGVGELARLMRVTRPDLHFVLINKSPAQLAMCPTDLERIEGVAEALPLNRGDVDAILATYVIGHVDMLAHFINECDRVLESRLRGGSHVYLYDLFKKDDSKPCWIERDLHYAERTVSGVARAFKDGGFNQVGHARYTDFVPAEIAKLMPQTVTLRNTVSAALVFTK
jgi:ubiquinone/menaquinone biosynthesis C-methylase UbiE